MISIFRMRPLTWFLILLLFNLLLLSLQVQNKEGVVLFRSLSLTLSTPVTTLFKSASTVSSQLLENYVLLSGAARENRRLRQENTSLRVEVNRLKGLVMMIPRVRQIQDLRQQYEFETVVAAVTLRSAGGRSPYLRDQVTINQGTSSGVGLDSAVLNADGLIGRVFVTAWSSSQVELITAETAAVGAALAESRLQGVILGDLGSRLRLAYIPDSATVENGEVVLTSGTDQIYPKGIPIGRVASSKSSRLIYRIIEVEPFVDFQRLEEVLVEKGTAESLERPAALLPDLSEESQ